MVTLDKLQPPPGGEVGVSLQLLSYRIGAPART
jgi:hypothetical protein